MSSDCAEYLVDCGTESTTVTSIISSKDGDVIGDEGFSRTKTDDKDSSGRLPVIVIMQTPRTSITEINPEWEPLSGLATDRTPAHGGIKYIAKAVELLKAAGIVCCMSYEPTLVYYGARRAVSEWIFCVPTEQVENATRLFHEQKDEYEPFRHPDAARPDSLDHFFPRFKVRSFALFFTLMSAQALNIPCTAENIEFSPNGIPYPKLHVYAQSLLDTYNLVDLVDLIDGMDLSIEWGEKNLNLEGSLDVAWGRWATDFGFGGQAPPDHVPNWCFNPPSRRGVWTEKASSERKLASRGFKAIPGDVTRFRKRGSPDPRSLERPFC